MAQTLILPGFNGSSDAHWQRIWASDRPGSLVVEQQSWSCPTLSEWHEKLDEALSLTDGAFLVAHSLGCLLAASYADRPLAGKIEGALLVAPCALDTATTMHPCLAGFGPEPLAVLPFPSILVASSNDPYISGAEAQRRANLWGNELVNIGAAGHINVESGFGRWQQGYDLLDRLFHSSHQSRQSLVSAPRRYAGNSSLR